MVTTPTINGSATINYSLDGEQATVNSNSVAIEYRYIDPPITEEINIIDEQTITTNPYIITVKVNDPNKVEKVDFYIDNILIGTSTLPDMEGVFECTWDTSKYHSTVKIVVTDIYGRPQEYTRNTNVSLPVPPIDTLPILFELPKTGEQIDLSSILGA